MNRVRTAVVLLGTTFAALAVAPATAGSVAGLFGQGRTHFSISAGSGDAFDQSYVVIGIGGSYNLLDGFSVGLHGERWSGAEPSITKVTPSVQYVFHQAKPVAPYVGVFYRRAYIDNLPDLDSSGGRAGVYFGVGRNAYLGAGVVRESYRDCSETVYRKCSDTYPEFGITLVF